MKKIAPRFFVFMVLLMAGSAFADNIVLVHGAHFSGHSWSRLVPMINPNINTVVVNLPGRDQEKNAKAITLSDYAASLCQDLRQLSGDIHIVAHSQGGAVAHRALSLCPRAPVRSIIYLTAVAPTAGQMAFELLSQQDADNYSASITLDKHTHRMTITDKDAFIRYFAQDASAQDKPIVASIALSEPAYIGDEAMVLEPTQLARVNKYYIFANQDKIISLASQLNIARHIELQAVYALDTGHSPMLTQPNALADILNRIIGK